MRNSLWGIAAGLGLWLFVLPGQALAACWMAGDPAGPVYGGPFQDTCSNTAPGGNAKGTVYYDCAEYCPGGFDLEGDCIRSDYGCFYHVFECNTPCGAENPNQGGGSCPSECRQGSSCGAGYSSASGCSGVIESGCKQIVTHRLKLPRAQWILEAAVLTAKARSTWMSGGWHKLVAARSLLPLAA